MVEAWRHYRDTRLGANASDADLRSRQDAFLHGARAMFGLVYALAHHADGLDEISLVLERLGEEIGFDDPGSAPWGDA
jgi:hypothetical protein